MFCPVGSNLQLKISACIFRDTIRKVIWTFRDLETYRVRTCQTDNRSLQPARPLHCTNKAFLAIVPRRNSDLILRGCRSSCTFYEDTFRWWWGFTLWHYSRYSRVFFCEIGFRVGVLTWGVVSVVVFAKKTPLGTATNFPWLPTWTNAQEETRLDLIFAPDLGENRRFRLRYMHSSNSAECIRGTLLDKELSIGMWLSSLL